MRRLIIALSVVIVLALLALGGHFGLGWWYPSHATIAEKASGYDTASEPATLEEALTIAKQSLGGIEQTVRDYSSIIIKKERIGSAVVETVMFAKIRENPFSVYLYYLDRSDSKGLTGREVIYAAGQNGDNLIVHTPGLQDATVGKMRLDPKGFLAMQGEHYPITEIGLSNLCRQLIQRGQSAGDPSQVAVKQYRRARINARACTLLEIIFPVHEPKIRGYLARVFVDNELHIPIRVEAHELPLEPAKGPQLVEEYTYLDVKCNNGYTDADFDPKNRQYKFP